VLVAGDGPLGGGKGKKRKKQNPLRAISLLEVVKIRTYVALTACLPVYVPHSTRKEGGLARLKVERQGEGGKICRRMRSNRG